MVIDTATVLFVCTGNICRSPTAERLLRHRLAERGADQAIHALSAGTGALVGHPIQTHAARLLAESGASVHEFAAQDVTRELVEDADLVLAMTREHRSAVAREAPRVLPRLFTLREFARLASAARDAGWSDRGDAATRLKSLVSAAREQRGMVPATEGDDVPDPYGGPEDGYREAFELIDADVARIAALLVPGAADG